MSNNKPISPSSEDQPPVFSTWKQVYVFVLVLHAFIITLFYLLTQGYQ